MKITKSTKFEEWATIWLVSMRGTVKDNTYYSTYKISIEKHLIPYFKSTPLGEITAMDIQLYFAQRSILYCVDTLKKDKSCLRRIFEAAQDNGLNLINPVRNIKIRSNSSFFDKEKKTYSAEQVKLIEEFSYHHRFGIEILVMMETGMRRGELLGLKWDDIDIENLYISISRAVSDCVNAAGKFEVVTSKPKNKYSVRIIPVKESLIRLLQRLKTLSNSDYCFPSSKSGQPISPRTWSRRHY